MVVLLLLLVLGELRRLGFGNSREGAKRIGVWWFGRRNDGFDVGGGRKKERVLLRSRLRRNNLCCRLLLF